MILIPDNSDESWSDPIAADSFRFTLANDIHGRTLSPREARAMITRPNASWLKRRVVRWLMK